MHQIVKLPIEYILYSFMMILPMTSFGATKDVPKLTLNSYESSFIENCNNNVKTNNNTLKTNRDYKKGNMKENNVGMNAGLKITQPTCQSDSIENILFPEIEPVREAYLQVSDIHKLWYAEYGNMEGIPVIVLHGGPGGGCSPIDVRLFDPQNYRIILVDQRGAGRSTPTAEMNGNTLFNLIEDLEKLRNHLGIQKWLVFGGSWGSTLAIAYGEEHPDWCMGFILRGVFLARQSDRDHVWYGMRDIYPEAWQEFVEYLPAQERENLIAAYYKRVISPDPAINLPAARAFIKYDVTCATLVNQTIVDEMLKNDVPVLTVARAFAHYSMNNFFLSPNQLLDNLGKINHLPAIIIHGRYDVICRASGAFELHKNWPSSKLVLVQDAGHLIREPGIARELITASEEIKNIILSLNTA